jgi:hypothetical protein
MSGFKNALPQLSNHWGLTGPWHRKEGFVNQFASLGALVTVESDAWIRSQAIFQEDDADFVAAMAAAAAVHGGACIAKSFYAMFNKQESAVTALSAWGDLDFEQLPVQIISASVSHSEVAV